MSEINKEIGKRICESRKKLGFTATELSKLTGYSSARISHWEQGKRLPNLDSILVLQKHLQVSAAYLLCIEIEQPTSESYSLKTIPVYDYISADKFKPVKQIQIPDNSNCDLFAIELIDDSMATLFQKGDIVVLDKLKQPIDGEHILLKLNKTKQILFRKFSISYPDIDSPQIQLIPNNKEFNVISSDNMEQFTVLGVYRNKFKLFI